MTTFIFGNDKVEITHVMGEESSPYEHVSLRYNEQKKNFCTKDYNRFMHLLEEKELRNTFLHAIVNDSDAMLRSIVVEINRTMEKETE